MKKMFLIFVNLLIINQLCFSQINSPADSVYLMVEEMPEFAGGMEKFIQFTKDSLKYPYRRICAEGIVLVQFIIEKDGNVSELKILKSLDKNFPKFDEEAFKIIRLTAFQWKVGKQNERPTRVRVTYPIRYK